MDEIHTELFCALQDKPYERYLPPPTGKVVITVQAGFLTGEGIGYIPMSNSQVFSNFNCIIEYSTMSLDEAVD